MTERHITECDWKGCEEQRPARENAACPPDWGLFIDGEGSEQHFCPEHVHRARRWCMAGVSDGQRLDVKHLHPGNESVEHAHVSTETHGIQVEGFGAGKLQSGESDGFGIYVHDHLIIEVRGAHKDEPRVLIKSEEFPTSVEVRDVENSFTELEIDG